MLIRYIISMGGATQSFPSFEKDNKGEWVFYDVDELEAVNLINAEYALPKVKKEYEDASKRVDELKAKKEAEKKLAEDLAKLDTLKARESELKAELKEVTASIKAVESAVKG
jgi:DNA repair exonuclease SbcCD ATPase subunit